LPEPFQYLGLWGCLSLVLQAYFGMLLCRTLYEGQAVFTIAGGLLFLLAPPMTPRLMGHFSLTGHWLILASLWAYWRPLTITSSAAWLRPFLIILLLVGGVHPYLGVMCLLVGVAAVARLGLEGRCSWLSAAGLLTLLTATLVTSMLICGF